MNDFILYALYAGKAQNTTPTLSALTPNQVNSRPLSQNDELRVVIAMMGKMNNVCRHYGCTKCCIKTEMPLSNSDITQIKDLGIPKDYFVLERNGSRHLKNLSGRCIFHDGKRCIIYNYRPEGCQLYPAVFDENKGKVILHLHCPHHGKFQLNPHTSSAVINLIRKLDLEEKRLACQE
jgi:hypothetical protein